jgi:hypothetical protein
VSFFSRCEAAFSNLTWTPICLEPQQPDSSTFESLNPAIHEPPKLVQNAWGRSHLIVLTAGAHQHPIDEHVMGITVVGLRERKQDHRLVPFRNICPPISPIQQQAVAGWQLSSPSHDLLKRGPFGSGRELPIQGGIMALGQVRGYRWVV